MTLVESGRRGDVVRDDARGSGSHVRTPPPGSRRRRAVAVTTLVVVVAVLGGAGVARRSTTPQPPTSPGPVLATREQLVTIAATTGHALYWAGDQGLPSFETTVSGRDVYVRYLTVASEVGTSSPRLTVGTYERSDAYEAVGRLAAAPGATVRRLRAGALVVVPRGSTSAYFAFRGSDLLMEVYDPTPGRALTLVTSGAVQPIESAHPMGTAPPIVAASPSSGPTPR